jgi:8-oxo-dGTP pyrophosphatase MutT (NUDIX family)
VLAVSFASYPSFPTRRRQAARVVVLDSGGRVLLIQSVDPANPAKSSWWEIPGGGMDPGETSAQTAARELREEAGIVEARIGPVVWTQSVQYTFAGLFFDQDEHIHVAWTEQTVLATPRLESLEALAFQARRWWTVDEVLDAETAFLPRHLPHLLPALIAGDLPDPPLDISGLD